MARTPTPSSQQQTTLYGHPSVAGEVTDGCLTVVCKFRAWDVRGTCCKRCYDNALKSHL